MHFESKVDHGTHSSVAGMPSQAHSTNMLTLDEGETIVIHVKTKGGVRTFDLMSSGYVVCFAESATEDSILFRLGGTTAIIGDKVLGSNPK